MKHEFSPQFQRLAESWDAYRADRSHEKARPLFRCAVEMLHGIRVNEVGPTLGILHGLCRMGHLRWPGGELIRGAVWCLRFHPQLYGRPLWNDFEMAGWQTTLDVYYTERIYGRLHSTHGMVEETCAWMVRSVCEQDAVFAEQWQRVLSFHAVNLGGRPRRSWWRRLFTGTRGGP